jgi:hypothetical protein
MPTPSQPSRAAFWAGWVFTALPAPLLLFSAGGKFLKPEAVVKGFTQLGWPDTLAVPLGILEVACVVLLLIPRTAVLGAILLTGYMGGAMATHLRIGEPWFLQAAVPIVPWIGLYLRDPRLRDLAPFRKPAAAS